MVGHWCLERSKDVLLAEMVSYPELSMAHYRNWLTLVRLSEYFDINWNGIQHHESYVASLPDSISAPAWEIGMIMDAVPQFVDLKWLEPDNIISSLKKADFEMPELMVKLALSVKSVNHIDQPGNPITIPENIDKSEDLILGPILILLAAEHLYNTGQYQDGMYLMTRFWHGSTSKHPMKYWCFDNYPEYLLRSYRIARWDGGRLPQFNNDYNHIIGDDPIIKSAYEQLQIYVGVIAGTIASITNLNE
jgi:hypothetical protein